MGDGRHTHPVPGLSRRPGLQQGGEAPGVTALRGVVKRRAPLLRTHTRALGAGCGVGRRRRRESTSHAPRGAGAVEGGAGARASSM